MDARMIVGRLTNALDIETREVHGKFRNPLIYSAGVASRIRFMVRPEIASGRATKADARGLMYVATA
jgi:hypothetical protein